MAGYIHITRLSARTGTDDLPLDTYQVNYSVGGITYVAAWSEEELSDFLRIRVPLEQDDFDAVMARLHESGHANIGDVDIPQNEASAMGMEMMPDDF